MKAVRTVEDKKTALKQRQQEQRNLGKHIDRILQEGQLSEEGASLGCGGRGLCPMLGRGMARFLGISQRVGAVSTKELDSVSVEQVSVAPKATEKMKTHSEISKRMFGVPAKKVSPQGKLAAAAESMKSRIESLESRSAQSRKLAHEQMKAGNKAAAMRELKRSKALEKQAVSTQGVMDAIEAQRDMLEQTTLQKEVADALGATAKSIKKEKGLISKAEDAVDAAAEMRDMHEDLVSVMAGLGDAISNDFDDEELLSELQDMMEENDTDTGGVEEASSSSNARDEEDARQEALRLEKQKKYEELQATRQQFPSAPKGKLAMEKQGLLLSQ